MVSMKWLAVPGLVAVVSAQSPNVVTWSQDGYGLSVNVPASTASNGRGAIYMQMSAPSGTQWFAFGQGTRMSGANMFIVYTDGKGNVTVSPRTASGHNMPTFNSNAQITILEGTQVLSDGGLVANVRCDSCLSWSGGTMSATSTKSNWIMAYKEGSSIDSSSTTRSISQHDTFNTNVQIDLTKGTGGSSSNPFVAAAAANPSSASASASGSRASASASASASSGSSASTSAYVPLASSTTSSAGTSSSNTVSRSNNTGSIRAAHAVIMSILFLVLFPSIALTLYLPYAQKVRYVHGPLQILNVLLLITGMALGIILGQRVGELDGYHQIIGFIVVALLVLVQPALGVYQHWHFSRTGGRTLMGIVHHWLGRCVILMGVVNGGLGFMISGAVGTNTVPTWAVVLYSIVAAIMFIIYVVVVTLAKLRSGRPNSESEKPIRSNEGYEMHSSSPGLGPSRFDNSRTYQQSRVQKIR